MTHRRLLTLLPCLLAFEVEDCFASTQEAELRIPAIVHSWRSTSLSDDADITAEELSKCVGVDQRIRAKYLELQRERVALGKEFANLPKLDEQFSSERTAIGIEDQRLKSMVASANEKQEELAIRRVQLYRSRPAASASPEQARKFNSAVADFNAEVSTSRRQLGDLNESLNRFRRRVGKFNEDIDANNQRIAPFNARSEAFRVAAGEFKSGYGDYLNKCAGERRIAK